MGAKVKVVNNAKHVAKRAYQGLRKAIFAGAGYVRLLARRSIRVSDLPSLPGTPPHSRRGQLKSAIAFAVESAEGAATQSAVIGPSALFVGPSGRAHEQGGVFRDETYPDRPFMGPALEQAAPRLPDPLKKLFS